MNEIKIIFDETSTMWYKSSVMNRDFLHIKNAYLCECLKRYGYLTLTAVKEHLGVDVKIPDDLGLYFDLDTGFNMMFTEIEGTNNYEITFKDYKAWER